MFPLRSVLRSPLRQPLNSIARPSFRPLQRPYSLPRLRPPSLGAKIWFRKDGTPRSKLRGLAITSLLAFAAVVSLATVGWQRATETYICLQRVDSGYATTDFSSFDAALQYFVNLCGPWLESPQLFCRSLTLVTEHDEALRDAVHTILCDAAEKAHEVLVSVEESHELLVGRNPEEFGRILKALVMSSKMSETVTRTIRDVVKPAMEALKPLMMQELEVRRDKAAEILDARRDKAADILRVKLKNMEERRAAREKDADKRHEILG